MEVGQVKRWARNGGGGQREGEEAEKGGVVAASGQTRAAYWLRPVVNKGAPGHWMGGGDHGQNPEKTASALHWKSRQNSVLPLEGYFSQGQPMSGGPERPRPLLFLPFPFIKILCIFYCLTALVCPSSPAPQTTRIPDPELTGASSLLLVPFL